MKPGIRPLSAAKQAFSQFTSNVYPFAQGGSELEPSGKNKSDIAKARAKV
jgi:hypothetical protein